MIEALLECLGIDYAVRDLNGITALQWGTCRDKVAAVGKLLDITSQDKTDEGANYRNFINHRAHMDGVSALFGAATAGQAVISKVLLESGADYYTYDAPRQNPRHLAVKQDFFEVVLLYMDFASREEDLQRCRNFMTAEDPRSGLSLGELAEVFGSVRIKRFIRDFFLSPVYQETLPMHQFTLTRSATVL